MDSLKFRNLYLVGSILFLLSSPLHKSFSDEIYTYVDEEGTLHITNSPTDPRYRLRRQGWLAEELGNRWYPPLSQIDAEINQSAAVYDLPPALIKAIIKVESDFDPYALSPKGATGLMQLMPKTAVAMEVKDVYNPRENIAGGARYLKYLMERFDHNLVLVLAAYHAGENRVLTYGAVPPIPETHQYIDRVLYYWGHYQERNELWP